MKTLKPGARLAWLLVALLLAVGASAREVRISWTLASVAEQVAGYRVYLLNEQSALPPIDVGLTNVYTFPDLSSDLRSLIFVTAYDSSGIESDASSVVEYPDESCL